MLLYPKLKKLKKNHLIKPTTNILNKKTKLNVETHYTYGIKTIENGYIFNNQIECIRKSLVRVLRLKRNKGEYSAFRFRIYPHVSITKKGKGVRMGNGKGSHNI
jgi:large subunit ribosomal protein L16